MSDLLWLIVIIVILVAVFGGATALALDLLWKIILVVVVLALIGALWGVFRRGTSRHYDRF